MNDNAYRRPGRLRRLTTTATVVALAVALVAGCASDEESSGGGGGGGGAGSGTFRVAAIVDGSGQFAPAVGTGGLAGFQAAVDQLDGEGGDEPHIEVEVYDTLSTPEGAQTAARSAVADGPDAIFLSLISSQIVTIRPILDQAAIPTVSILNTPAEVDPVVPWFYTVSPTVPQFAQYWADGAADVSGGDLDGVKVAFAALESSNLDTIIEAPEGLLDDAGAEVVGEERRDVAATSFDSQAQQLVDSGAEVILASDAGSGPGIIVDALETAGYTGSILFLEGLPGSTAFLEEQQNPQVLAARAYQVVDEAPDVASALDEAGEDPSGGFVTYGWTAAQVLAEAFRDCGDSCGGDALIGALDGLTDFDPPGDVAFAPLQFSPERHDAVAGVQYYAWDAEAGAVATATDPIDLSGR